MATLYFIFLRDALKVAAAGVLVVLLSLAALYKLGVPAEVLVMWPWMFSFPGFMLLAQRYVGKNLGWVIGLPQTKLAIAWFNFVVNLSMLAIVLVSCWCVVALTEGFAAGDTHPREHISSFANPGLWSMPHGRLLAVAVFAGTAMLMACWSVMRQPDAAERSRQKRRKIVLLVLGAALGMAIPSIVRSEVGSPLLVFVALTAMTCVGGPHATAKALGTSLRQRRTWAMVGAAIAILEIVVVVAVTVSDLRAANPAIREEAAKLLGSFGH